MEQNLPCSGLHDCTPSVEAHGSHLENCRYHLVAIWKWKRNLKIKIYQETDKTELSIMILSLLDKIVIFKFGIISISSIYLPTYFFHTTPPTASMTDYAICKYDERLSLII